MTDMYALDRVGNGKDLAEELLTYSARSVHTFTMDITSLGPVFLTCRWGQAGSWH